MKQLLPRNWRKSCANRTSARVHTCARCMSRMHAIACSRAFNWASFRRTVVCEMTRKSTAASEMRFFYVSSTRCSISSPLSRRRPSSSSCESAAWSLMTHSLYPSRLYTRTYGIRTPEDIQRRKFVKRLVRPNCQYLWLWWLMRMVERAEDEEALSDGWGTLNSEIISKPSCEPLRKFGRNRPKNETRSQRRTG